MAAACDAHRARAIFMQTVGIDLGTTNTVASVERRGAAVARRSGPTRRSCRRSSRICPTERSSVGRQGARAPRGRREEHALLRQARDRRELAFVPRARIREHYPFDLDPAPRRPGRVQDARRHAHRDRSRERDRGRAVPRGSTPIRASVDAVVTVPAAFGPAQRAATLAGGARGRLRARAHASPSRSRPRSRT